VVVPEGGTSELFSRGASLGPWSESIIASLGRGVAEPSWSET